jgi:hypothetical protein
MVNLTLYSGRTHPACPILRKPNHCPEAFGIVPLSALRSIRLGRFRACAKNTTVPMLFPRGCRNRLFAIKMLDHVAGWAISAPCSVRHSCRGATGPAIGLLHFRSRLVCAADIAHCVEPFVDKRRTYIRSLGRRICIAWAWYSRTMVVVGLPGRKTNNTALAQLSLRAPLCCGNAAEAKPPAPLSRAGGLRSADANGCCALVSGRWRRRRPATVRSGPLPATCGASTPST